MPDPRQQADLFKSVHDQAVVSCQTILLVHDLHRRDQLSDIMQPHTHEKFLYFSVIKTPDRMIFMQPFDKTLCICYHVLRMVRVVGRSGIDRR